MRPTPIYDELTARQRAGRLTAGTPPEEPTGVLSFPAGPVAPPAELPRRRPRHELRRG